MPTICAATNSLPTILSFLLPRTTLTLCLCVEAKKSPIKRITDSLHEVTATAAYIDLFS